MIRVMFIENQQLFQDGFAAILHKEEEIELVGMAVDGQEAMERFEETNPDVVLISIRKPYLDGIQTIALIKKRNPDVKVIILSASLEDEVVIRGINAGADGFLLGDVFADRLLTAIHEVYQGGNVISGKVANLLVDRIRQLTMDEKQLLVTRLENRGIMLTKRAIDVAYLFMDNQSNKQIANKLYLSEGTVKNYISEIYNRLDIHKRDEAIRYLVKLVRSYGI
ncbi:response regulator transcription factor [Oceanobacillus bengalensis]|uniref:DNA-binding response regulator n=1 Tax=Oceanobacillus bengalensis TaxID=1435466 RepID=A0A494YSL7_9BACI|nr:response regulator transcription factor [Oceanobacillus bengalensis]RKQ12970.1 DNA-binding response regulator [Oceanobacillus bengalensis]